MQLFDIVSRLTQSKLCLGVFLKVVIRRVSVPPSSVLRRRCTCSCERRSFRFAPEATSLKRWLANYLAHGSISSGQSEMKRQCSWKSSMMIFPGRWLWAAQESSFHVRRFWISNFRFRPQGASMSYPRTSLKGLDDIAYLSMFKESNSNI